MSRDNKDRYGYGHRNDPAYDTGESMPGDVGDSKGTFHDRARKNSNVIVDGEVQSEESYRRSNAEVSNDQSNTTSRSSRSSGTGVSQSEIEGEVVEVTIKSDGGTRDTMGRYKNHQVHIEGGTVGETIRVRLQAEQGYLVGRRVSVKE
ncbi:hypothetical protein GCM10009037_26610 [Halarchaeum grantii]|uniref:TRAM domain-containing protein n=1 Tax=Halarchaeum grantii TaxID=1193105 RepID=A0A830FCS1_9EURY|nr:hypothetical protein [Halarchaeum grantii]GGL41688.1 hypothetical protein GCM10009037_26610 [Halarchaeum grantii]